MGRKLLDENYHNFVDLHVAVIHKVELTGVDSVPGHDVIHVHLASVLLPECDIIASFEITTVIEFVLSAI